MHMTKVRQHLILGILGLAYGMPVLADTTADGPWTHAPYHLGQGVTFPYLGLNIGGYISLRFEDIKDRDWSIGARDLSLFFSENISITINRARKCPDRMTIRWNE